MTLSEDSLYLNIWTPAQNSDAQLPVAFWIHGGAFMGGFGHEKEFDGAAFCNKGVILVTVNYRLGPIGFFSHPLLTRESTLGNVGNYGILDQIAALEWVRENIGAFGGDRERITVMGQSAGCMSVQTLVSSPMTKGMIAGAILQSGIGLSYDHMPEMAEAEGMEIAAAMGAQTLEDLRAKGYDEIMQASGAVMARGFATMELPFSPVIDGKVLAGGYNSTLHEGRIHDIPYMIGCTKNDIATDPNHPEEKGKVYDGCMDWVQARKENGKEAPFVYYFTRQLPGDSEGAFHSSELWYMFGTYGRCWRPLTAADAVLSEKMVTYWTNFIKTGNPNGLGVPKWNRYAEEDDLMVLDVEE